MALIDIYTDRNEPTGKKVEKKEAHANGLWHRVFTCLVINPDKKTAFLQKKHQEDMFLKDQIIWMSQLVVTMKLAKV